MTTNLRIFRELKARKAKYGFQSHMSIDTIPALAECMKQAKWIDPDVRFETKTDMGSNEFKVYTDNDDLATMMQRSFLK